MTQEEIRSYEISIWSLQDDFITVLKAVNIESKGQTQEGEMKLNVDGTQELKFNIPMYLNKNGKLVENPAWYNYINGIIIADMRKIKVILNKNEDDEKVYEFLITKVTEVHEKNELKCEVECEGLAFHELGKTGYKVSLVSDDFYNDDYEYATTSAWIDSTGTIRTDEPLANLQYWADKFLEPYPTDGSIVDARTWYYSVEMNWNGYTRYENDSGELIQRAFNKVYEDEYVGSWTVSSADWSIAPGAVVGYQEKARMMDAEESNKYNLTQDLAETFGVYCKYIYDYDDNYHIVERRVVFYNNYIAEDEGAIDITYKYNAEKISREMDCTDLVTKMYVKTVEDDSTAAGIITIMDVDANKSKEDYLLNFDYLYGIGAISEEAYEYIEEYEAQMRYYNELLTPISTQINALNYSLPEVQAKNKTAENAISADEEQIEAQNDWFNSVTNGTGTISVTSLNPKSFFRRLDQNDNNGTYYISLTEEGILSDSFHLYTSWDSTSHALFNEITGWTPNYDEFNYLTKITNLAAPGSNESTKVYAIYDYVPNDYHDSVRNVWVTRLANDTTTYEATSAQIEEIESQITSLTSSYNEYLIEKQEVIEDFEKMMGAALREGNWEPDDYTDYGDKYLESFTLNSTVGLISDRGEKSYIVFSSVSIYDDEQKSYYEVGTEQTITYYPFISLAGLTSTQFASVQENLDKLCILYYDFHEAGDKTHDPSNRRALALGSQCELAFLAYQGGSTTAATAFPVILITGAESLSATQLNYLINTQYNYSDTSATEWTSAEKPALGYLNSSWDDTEKIYSVTETDFVQDITVTKISSSSVYKPYTCYPRIVVESLALKTSEDQLIIKYNDQLLTNYEDYNVLTNGTDEKYYITIKPEVIIKNAPSPSSWVNSGAIKFTLSNANTAIYLDAKEILKDSSKPQVSYDVDISLLEKNLKTTYNLLNRIVHINDYELKFENVQGYVSEVTLNLDQPWEDKIEIKNYKTKFEDLFEKITASSEQMKKNEYIAGVVSNAFSASGVLTNDTAKQVAAQDVDYTFDDGKLELTNDNGIMASSDLGVVAMRGGGIFTATEKDSAGNWQWNTAITPSGINANLIKAGQLDTNKIRVFAGDQTRFQLNGEGFYAYKSFFSDAGTEADLSDTDIDASQYVVLNPEGLFLVAEANANIWDSSNSAYVTTSVDINRVEISWDGLILRNYAGDETFFADPSTGDLDITGTITANSGAIGPWIIEDNSIYYLSDSGTISDYWTDSDMYFGKNGLKIYDYFTVGVNTSYERVENFIIGSSDTSATADDYVLRVEYEDDTSAYNFTLGNVNFSDNTLNLFTQLIPNTIYSVNTSTSGIPDFDEEAEDGSLGIFYTATTTSANTSAETFAAFSSAFTESESAHYPGSTSVSGKDSQSFFGTTFKRSNVNGSSSASASSNLTDYVRAGVAHTSSNTAVAYGRMITNSIGASAGSTIKLTFQYVPYNGSSYDDLNSGTTRATSFTVKLYACSSAIPSSTTVTEVASTTCTIPPTTYTASTTPVSKVVSMTLTNSIAAENTYLFGVIYSKTARSLTYINVQTMYIGSNSSTTTNEYSLWLKSNSEWVKLIGSS